jgi:hypothetical protein
MSKHRSNATNVPRVWTIARELRKPSIELMIWLRNHGHEVKSASSPVYLNQLSPDDLVTLILDSHKVTNSYHARHCDWSIATPISFPREA